MSGLVLFDLDGTLIESHLIQDEGKLRPRRDQAFTEPVVLPNRLERIAELAMSDTRFGIVTNQGGVAWGYCNVTEARLRIARAIAGLNFFFGQPFTVHVCFSHPRATVKEYRDGHERRKPSGRMILEAFGAHYPKDEGLPLDTLFVGNLDDDNEAARNAGCDFTRAEDFFDV